MAINREISQFSNFVSVDDNTKKVSISTSFDIGGDSVISGDVTVGTATTGVVARNDGTLNVSGTATFQNDVDLGDDNKLKFGDNGKFKIYHDGSLGYNIVKGEGSSDEASLYFITNEVLFYDQSGNNFKAKFTDGGPVSLFHNGTKTFETVGSGISISSGTASTATIFGPENIIIDPSPVGVGTTSGNVYIKGDLYVDGTRTEINSTTLTIDDLNVVVASGATNSIEADGAGIEVDGASATLQYATSGDKWVFNKAPYYNTNRLLTTADQGTGNGIDADTLDGQEGTYYLDYTNFTNTPPDVRWFETAVGIWTSSSVGIGTTNPTSTLMVDGTLNVSGVSTFQDHVVIGAGKSIQIGPTADQLSLEYDTNGLGLIRQNNELFLLSPSIQIGNLDSSKISATFLPTGAVKLNHNNITKLQTHDYGIDVTGRVETDTLNVSGVSTFQNGIRADVGATTDIALKIGGITEVNSLEFKYRGGTPGARSLSIEALNNTDIEFRTSGNFDVWNLTGNNHSLRATPGGSVELYHNNNKKLETTSIGIDVTGHTETDTLNVSGISTFASDLDINADVNVSGIVTARSFVGSGELLTNLDAYAAYTSDRSTLATIADKISGIATYSEDQGFNYLGGNESYHGNSFFYGADIEASDDGKVMFVSSIPYNTGNQAGCGVQIYERTNSNFNYVGFVTSLSHHTLGAGQTVGDLGTWFGPTLASNADGSIFAVGSPGTNPNNGTDYEYGFFDQYNTWEGNHGYISIFQKTGNNIEPLGIITAPPADINDNNISMFGHAVALNADGTKLYVSAPGISTDTYGTLPDGTGGSGTTNQLGLVYAYNKVGTSYQQVGVITSHRMNDYTIRDTWGHRVVCSDDGDTIYISGPESDAANNYDGEGIVEVYSRTGNTISHVGILTHGYDSQAQTRWQNSHFGISMDCSSDGNIVAIAARPNYDSNLTPRGGGGALFVFEKTGTNTFTKIAEEVFDRYSVISNQILEIGSYDLRVNSDASTIVMSASDLTSAQGSNPGGHFVAFSRDGGNISRIGNFTALLPQPAGAAYNFTMFGSRLAIDSTSDNVFVGAPVHALGSTSNVLADKGSAYVFNVSRQIALHSNQITGNIGIGTDNPTSSLDVNGTLNVSGISTFQDDVNIGIGQTTTFFDVSSGRVGIGRTNPTKLLDIDGTLGVSGVSYFTNAVSIQPSNSSTIPLNFKSTSGFIPQIFFNRTSTTVGYGIHYFIGGGSTGHAIHQLDSGSNFEIGLNGGSFIVGDNTFGGFPVTTKAFEVKEDAETYLTHNHNKKLETTEYGVTVTGGLNVSGISTAESYFGSNNQNFIAQSSPTGIGTTNVIIGHLAGITTFTGVDDKINSSVLIGERAGNQHREIANSVVIGKDNLSNVTSDDSVIIGRNIGIATDGAISNTSGLDSGIYIGRNIYNNTTKQLNYWSRNPILIGENILSLNVEESSSSQPLLPIVIGYEAAKRRVGGNYDIYIGYGAGQGVDNQNLITNPNTFGGGSSNIMLGFDAGRYMSHPKRSVVIGHIAGTTVAANDNIIIGGLAGYAVTTGASNILIGAKAGYALTEGSQNIVIGSGSQTINGNVGDGPEVNDTSGDKQLVIGAGRTDRWISGDSNFNIGIGHTYGDTINAKLDVKGDVKVNDVYHVQAGVSTFTASAGVAYTANSYPSSDFVNAEYTLFFEHTSGIQSQKVLVMDDGSTAYSQEYAIMTSNDLLVSVGATVKSSNVELWVTPETGVSGIITYKFTRESII